VTLTVTLTSNCPDSCSVTIHAWTFGLSHDVTMHVATSTEFSLYLLSGGVVAIVAMASAAAYYLRRRSVMHN
jgi:hypothetical protein